MSTPTPRPDTTVSLCIGDQTERNDPAEVSSEQVIARALLDCMMQSSLRVSGALSALPPTLECVLCINRNTGEVVFREPHVSLPCTTEWFQVQGSLSRLDSRPHFEVSQAFVQNLNEQTPQVGQYGAILHYLQRQLGGQGATGPFIAIDTDKIRMSSTEKREYNRRVIDGILEGKEASALMTVRLLPGTSLLYSGLRLVLLAMNQEGVIVGYTRAMPEPLNPRGSYYPTGLMQGTRVRAVLYQNLVIPVTTQESLTPEQRAALDDVFRSQGQQIDAVMPRIEHAIQTITQRGVCWRLWLGIAEHIYTANKGKKTIVMCVDRDRSGAWRITSTPKAPLITITLNADFPLTGMCGSLTYELRGNWDTGLKSEVVKYLDILCERAREQGAWFVEISAKK
ncbi:MAG: hypothetical protein ACD_62C00691G0012 [uncultured bacterium]|nr:MAG: hypothetical protein ACD_62C00691G0012 [uncultured bacterium]